MSPKPILPKPALMLVTNLKMAGGEGALVELLTKAVKAGVNIVQLREKEISGSELVHISRVIKRATMGKALFLINDRTDAALGCSADGVQLPERSLPVTVVSAIGPNLLIGCSVHSAMGVAQAELTGADFALLGTIFETGSKPGIKPAGVELITQSIALANIPIIAIGGINASNAAQVMQAGASGIAVQSAILKAANPENAARELKAIIDKSFKQKEAI